MNILIFAQSLERDNVSNFFSAERLELIADLTGPVCAYFVIVTVGSIMVSEIINTASDKENGMAGPLVFLSLMILLTLLGVFFVFDEIWRPIA